MALTGRLQVNAWLTCHIFDDIPISLRNNFPSQFKRRSQLPRSQRKIVGQDAKVSYRIKSGHTPIFQSNPLYY